jgi:phage shock protein A
MGKALFERFMSPQDRVNAILDNLGNQITTCEKGTIELKTRKKLAERSQQAAVTEFEAWTERAKQALTKGREDLAEKAAFEAVKYQKEINKFDIIIQQIEPEISFIQSEVLKLKDQKDTLESKMELLTTKLSIAQAREEITLLLTGIAGNSYTKQLKEIENEVTKQECRALATTETARELTGQSVKEEFESLDNQISQDHAKVFLENLKKEVKALPGQGEITIEAETVEDKVEA